MLDEQQRKDRRQEHEDECLNEADQQLHQIERHLYQPADTPNRGHRLEHSFAGEDISVQPKAQRDRSEHDRNHLEHTGNEEDRDQQQPQRPGALSLRRKQLVDDTDRTDFAHTPDDPAGEEDQGHRKREVDVGVRPAEERFVDPEALWSRVPPADGTNARYEADPVGCEDEDEDRGEEPEGPPYQVRTQDALEKVVEAFDEPLDEVL